VPHCHPDLAKKETEAGGLPDLNEFRHISRCRYCGKSASQCLAERDIAAASDAPLPNLICKPEEMPAAPVHLLFDSFRTPRKLEPFGIP
jgi:hypothetical protein